MAAREVINGTELVWQLPPAWPTAAGLVLLAHGCRQNPRVWFPKSEKCAECSPRAEERCLAEHALGLGYAVVAAANGAGSKGCWQASDVQPVRRALDSWRRSRGAEALDLFLLGPSSGGYFSTTAARHWADVRAVSAQVFVPASSDVVPPLPSGAARFPPLELVLMRRDAAKLRDAELVAAAWSGAADGLRRVVVPPMRTSAEFFSERVAGLSVAASRAVYDELVKAGRIDRGSGLVHEHPARGKWKTEVSRGLSGQSRDSLPQRSTTVAMDGIFGSLDLAWGYHASTCTVADGTFAFFAKHASRGPRPGALGGGGQASGRGGGAHGHRRSAPVAAQDRH